MEEELNYLKTVGVTNRAEVTEETFFLCKPQSGFVPAFIAKVDISSHSVYIIPKTTTEFKYAQSDQIDNSIALTSEEYFDFIFGRVAFLDGLNGITMVL